MNTEQTRDNLFKYISLWFMKVYGTKVFTKPLPFLSILTHAIDKNNRGNRIDQKNLNHS